MKRIKNFLFHVNLMYATWKQIRRYPKMKKYNVFYLPFSQSDVEAEMILYATDEKDAKKVFERTHPGLVFVRVEEK